MENLEGFPSLLIPSLRGQVDSDWGNGESRRSNSGNLMLYNKTPIMWRSKTQETTALSPAKAE